MPLIRIASAALALVMSVGVAGAQVREGQDAPWALGAEPDFRLVVLGDFDAESLAAFNRRVQDYSGLRTRMEIGLTPLVVTDNADEIERFERRLAERTRDALGSRRYQVFVPLMEGQVKRLLRTKADAGTVALILEDGPSEFDVDVNDTYSKRRSLATMPPNILLLLPDLPPDMEYRFVGRHLIPRDVRANMIIDEIPYALRCEGCAMKSKEEEDDEIESAPQARYGRAPWYARRPYRETKEQCHGTTKGL
ncbi:MAG: hypothetical protein EXQ48_08640 [Acidobacteria bacterium]|nr:hypothetical protein [Acidobacteriota bacterium]